MLIILDFFNNINTIIQIENHLLLLKENPTCLIRASIFSPTKSQYETPLVFHPQKSKALLILN
jgi:hypothetical protein